MSLFSSHISVALFSLECGSLQLLRLLVQFVVELIYSPLSLYNPVTQNKLIYLKGHWFVNSIMFYLLYIVTIHANKYLNISKV